MNADFQIQFASTSRWPHRLAIILCCATFPLVWVGGLVTTYNAGMAFKDWPTSDGYFLFFYPWLDWLRGPWELFVEHGHRMLAAFVGMLTIALCVSLWMTKQPKWLRGLGALALVAVIFQGLLGGARVLLDERTLAMIHGCFGPVFLSILAVLAATTSKSWRAKQTGEASPRLLISSTAMPVFVFIQLVIGAQLRHFAPDGAHTTFGAILLFHVVVAIGLAAFVLAVTIGIWRTQLSVTPFKLLAIILPVCVLLQIMLGAATWVYKYNWPAFMANSDVASTFIVQAMGWRQAQVTTAHVALGSLILALSSVLAAFAIQVLRTTATQTENSSRSSSVFLPTEKLLVEAAV
jgi:heme a synthase